MIKTKFHENTKKKIHLSNFYNNQNYSIGKRMKKVYLSQIETNIKKEKDVKIFNSIPVVKNEKSKSIIAIIWKFIVISFGLIFVLPTSFWIIEDIFISKSFYHYYPAYRVKLPIFLLTLFIGYIIFFKIKPQNQFLTDVFQGYPKTITGKESKEVIEFVKPYYDENKGIQKIPKQLLKDNILVNIDGLLSKEKYKKYTILNDKNVIYIKNKKTI